MTGEEFAGPAGPKVVRLISFVGAGAVCVFAINKWRELEQKSVEKNEEQQLSDAQSNSNAIQKALK